ncbi:hypothetical protein AArc1_1698 [Natrarchaeobaculum sulfurireducens]|uniref:Uncharacterized protein n=1 Tax=Natrarchaeobaculum sulfurireducens TaxID=2044521 RepID=A0A346PET1_9EURY|nr:hypothetical protein AArc1_1698 [Natrarchaeobaculum sulfurireducens]
MNPGDLLVSITINDGEPVKIEYPYENTGSGESLDGGDLTCRITSLKASHWNVFTKGVEDSHNDEAN